MCQAFSCIVRRDGLVYWKAGLDSHDDIADHFGLVDTIGHRDLKDFARVEISPPSARGFLYPRKRWEFKLDDQQPSWWDSSYELKSRRALVEWKRQVYALLNLQEARKPINPLEGKPKQPTDKDYALLEQWASVGDSVWASVRDSVEASVWASVGASVWASVRASVRASVWAYIGSLFALPQWANGYPYQPVVDLWRKGFVASYDGKVWRLHSGQNALVVYERVS